jgi:hypothetical protein
MSACMAATTSEVALPASAWAVGAGTDAGGEAVPRDRFCLVTGGVRLAATGRFGRLVEGAAPLFVGPALCGVLLRGCEAGGGAITGVQACWVSASVREVAGSRPEAKAGVGLLSAASWGGGMLSDEEATQSSCWTRMVAASSSSASMASHWGRPGLEGVKKSVMAG